MEAAAAWASMNCSACYKSSSVLEEFGWNYIVNKPRYPPRIGEKDGASLFLYSPYGSNCIPVPLLLRVYFSPYMHNESWKQAHYWIRDTEKTLPSDIVSFVHPPSRYQLRARPQQVEVASAHHHGH
jgi:hypothetical protein